MDSLAMNGCMGQVITVGKGIAPQSDIAVFNMLGYNFKNGEYVGRGVIESIGCNIDFRNGDLALRGNFATIDNNLRIIDRRAGRIISKDEAQSICKTLRKRIKFSDKDVTIALEPTIGHRLTIRFRHDKMTLSDKITNTDPAYDKVEGIGIAKQVTTNMRIKRSNAQENTESARTASKILNEFTEQSIELLKDHPINKARMLSGKKTMTAILARDSGNKYPQVEPISKKYGINIACIVDMPVEIGISKVLKMKAFEAGDISDYEKKANVASRVLEKYDAIYVHIKGPDEFGHDGDAKGKMKNIEEIDKRFFGSLINELKVKEPIIIISGDHSTPCVRKGHSDDPVPVLFSGDKITKDESKRFTERCASKGRIGFLMGADVLTTAISIITK